MTQLQIGVIQTKTKIGIGEDIVVSKRAVGTDRRPGENGGGDGDRRIGVIGNFVGLSERGAGFGDHLELGGFEG